MEVDLGALLDKMTDKQKETLVDKLFPLIRRRITMQSEATPFGNQVKGFADMQRMDLVVLPSGQLITKNPLKKEISGYFVVAGDDKQSVNLTKQSFKQLEFNTSSLVAGTKVKVMIF